MIANLEEYLEVRLPPTYKTFLATCGAVAINGIEFYGVYRDPKSGWAHVSDLVRQTEFRRSNGLARDILVIGNAYDDVDYGIDSRIVGDDGECPVVDILLDNDTRNFAENFGVFMLNRIEASLSI